MDYFGHHGKRAALKLIREAFPNIEERRDIAAPTTPEEKGEICLALAACDPEILPYALRLALEHLLECDEPQHAGAVVRFLTPEDEDAPDASEPLLEQLDPKATARMLRMIRAAMNDPELSPLKTPEQVEDAFQILRDVIELGEDEFFRKHFGEAESERFAAQRERARRNKRESLERMTPHQAAAIVAWLELAREAPQLFSLRDEIDEAVFYWQSRCHEHPPPQA